MRLKFANIQTEATAALKRHSRQRRSRSDFFLTSFFATTLTYYPRTERPPGDTDAGLTVESQLSHTLH